jgi:hypothetical protein
MNAIAILVQWLFHLCTSGMHLLTTSCLKGLKTGAAHPHQIVANELTDQPMAGHTMYLRELVSCIGRRRCTSA